MNRELDRRTDKWKMGRYNLDLVWPPKTCVLEAWFPESIWKVSKAFKGGTVWRCAFNGIMKPIYSCLLRGPKVTTFALPLVPYLIHVLVMFIPLGVPHDTRQQSDEKLDYLFGEQRDSPSFSSSFLWKSLLLHTPPKIKGKLKCWFGGSWWHSRRPV